MKFKWIPFVLIGYFLSMFVIGYFRRSRAWGDLDDGVSRLFGMNMNMTIAAVSGVIFLLCIWYLWKKRRDVRSLANQSAEDAAKKIEGQEQKKNDKNELAQRGYRWLPMVKYVIIGGFVSVLFGVVWPYLSSPPTPPPTIYFSEFLTHIEENKISDVFIVPVEGGTREIIGRYSADHSSFRTVDPGDNPGLVPLLRKHNVQILSEHTKKPSMLYALFMSLLPTLLVLGLLIFFISKMRAGGMGGTPFGKKKNSEVQKPKETFADVAGVTEAKEELQEVVEFLKDPKKFSRLGGRVPRGVLLIGPPGTGKTLLARAVAGEANTPFFSISGSEFVEVFVGVGASRVRDLFEQAQQKKTPCIIFIDEIDAVGRHRGAGMGGGNDEREQTLNQLLAQMDGFEQSSGIIVIAATNRPDILDPALLRPGRFDRQVVVDKPDLNGREAILRVHARGKPIANDVDLRNIAAGTSGFSGADLANLVNEAALFAARTNKTEIDVKDFSFAKHKVMSGAERKILISDEEKKITAYHEAGHTLTAKLLPGADPVDRVSIIPRGRALGMTIQQPENERYHATKAYLETMLMTMMGGRIAEELIFGAENITTGASNDLERATDMARQMVCKWAMSNLGHRTFGKQEEMVFLRREIANQKDYSEKTAVAIDREMRAITDDAYAKAQRLIGEHINILHGLAIALLEKETLEREEIDAIVNAALDKTAQS